MRPSFKVVFTEKKSTYWSREQCTGSTKKKHPLGNAQNLLPKLKLSTKWALRYINKPFYEA